MPFQDSLLKFKGFTLRKENGKTVAYCEVLDDKTEAKYSDK